MVGHEFTVEAGRDFQEWGWVGRDFRSQRNREKVLAEFNENKEKKVLLMSLKVGGVGLNLTAANNVFIMDLWWNPAVEEQVIMRIHRIGQKRTVQARKQNMIAGALTDEDVRSARIEELKML